MIYKITYCDIQSSHILATPSPSSEEYVKTNDPKKLEKYILSKKDMHGHPFKKEKKYGFDYISNAGGVIVSVVKIKAI